MGLFRKQPQTDAPTVSPPAAPEEGASPLAPVTSASAPTTAPFKGAQVDLDAVYKGAKLATEELDRVARAEGLLHLIPSKASHTREIVDATFHAFGVDRTRIVDAAAKQLDALEDFVRYSHEQTQLVLDASDKRITEIEAEIERARQAAAQAKTEGEERARTVNAEMLKVQRVLDFFGSEQDGAHAEGELDASTEVRKTGDAPKASAAEPKVIAETTSKPQ